MARGRRRKLCRMGMLETLAKRRPSGGGLFLLVLLAALLAFPLWQARDVDHPLASREHFDVCGLLPAPPAGLASLQRRPGADRCDIVDGAGATVLSVGLTSQRGNGPGSPRLREVYATWLKEVRASGAVELREEPGPWRSATSYRMGTHHELLVEDGGLMIVLVSDRLEAPALVSYAGTLAAVLRSA